MLQKFREMEPVTFVIDGKPRKAVAVTAERRRGELWLYLVDSGGIPVFRVWERLRLRLNLPGLSDFKWKFISPNFAVSAEPIPLAAWQASQKREKAAAASDFLEAMDAPFYDGPEEPGPTCVECGLLIESGGVVCGCMLCEAA